MVLAATSVALPIPRTPACKHDMRACDMCIQRNQALEGKLCTDSTSVCQRPETAFAVPCTESTPPSVYVLACTFKLQACAHALHCTRVRARAHTHTHTLLHSYTHTHIPCMHRCFPLHKKKRKAQAFRRHNGSLCTQKQPNIPLQALTHCKHAPGIF